MHKIYTDKLTILLLVLPALLLFFVFIPIPVVFSFLISLCKWNIVGNAEFVGLKNYVFMLKEDVIFWEVMKNTGIWLLGGFICQIIPAFLLALLLNSKIKGMNFFRGLIFMPVTLSAVVTALIWYFIYHPEIGVVNQIIRLAGFNNFNHAWLSDKKFAMYGVIIACAWQWTGYYIVIYLAGLTIIPDNIIESAKIDGANSLQILINIIIPYMIPLLKVTSILIVTASFKGFGIMLAMTGGGPNHSTELIALYMYRKAFSYSWYGYGSAISVVIMLFCIISAVGLNRLFERDTMVL